MRKIFVIACMMLGLSIAQAQTLNYPLDTINGKVYYRYQVEKSIGLWRVSQNFGVRQEEIIEANPQLRDRGLHVDEILHIPARIVEIAADSVQASASVTSTTTTTTTTTTLPAEVKRPLQDQVVARPLAGSALSKTAIPAVAVQAVSVTTTTSDTLTKTDTVAAEADTTVRAVDEKRMRIAYLLPLQAKATQRDNSMNRFLEFYEGALLAINDLQKSGEKFEIYVYDVEKSNQRISQLLADGSLDKMDAIIGPTYPVQVAEIVGYSKEKQIPTLIPFTDQVPGISTNPYVMQFNATDQQKASKIVDYLESRKDEINCVLLEGKDADIPSSIRLLRKEILARDIPHTWSSIHEILVDSLSNSLKDSVENFLLFNTEKYGNLQVLMPKVLRAKEGKQLSLFSQFSWQKERILLDQLYTSMFSTEIDNDLTEYTASFDQYFGNTIENVNPRYDLLGYDLTRELVAFLQGKEYFGLQSDIHFERISEGGGFVNTGVRVIR